MVLYKVFSKELASILIMQHMNSHIAQSCWNIRQRTINLKNNLKSFVELFLLVNIFFLLLSVYLNFTQCLISFSSMDELFLLYGRLTKGI